MIAPAAFRSGLIHLAAILCTSFICHSATASLQAVKLFTGGGTNDLHAYKIELVERALSLTQPEFGDYSLELVNPDISYKRAAVLFAKGEVFNLTWAPVHSDIPHHAVTALDLDFSQGLVGYRICLVDSAHKANTQLQSKEQLRQLRIGIGAYWPDVTILRHNRLQVFDDVEYTQLFGQLKADRFDCIPLGINEVQRALADQQATYPSLSLDPHLLIHYPYPMRFFASNHHPRLIERMNLGFAKLQNTGEFAEIFAKHHQHLEQLNLSSRQLICLDAPHSQSAQHSKDEPPRCALPTIISKPASSAKRFQP